MPESEDATPKPGHFLPGGSEEPAPGSRPLVLKSRQPDGLGRARSVTLDDSPARRKARPIPTEPGTASEYSGPPVAPLTGGPLPPLTGTRRIGGQRTTGWHKNPSRGVPQFSTEPPPVKPPRHYSHRVIAGLSALVLVMLTGATVAGFKLINSYDTRVDNPLSQPSVKKSQIPIPTPPDPTVTVTVPGIPDMVRLQKNKIYTSGKVAAVSCKEPAIKPDSQSAILRYYQALLPCLNKAWEPIVKRAGYDFRAPKLRLQTSQATSEDTCTGESDTAFYCGYDESINISWKNDLAYYKNSPEGARVWMLDTMAHEYGHHVQKMTEMLTAEDSREGWTNSKAMKLEWSRRLELQATCFGAAFLGANKKPLGMSGEKLHVWQWETQHSGDEYSTKKLRDHGSRKNNWAWADPGFKSASPASCNTFTAPPTKVS
ncbi:neutral zinc metallopeptidase [Kribbella sp. NPDC000426]|uniref:neutral zinc metallopeptidase n=1 Tax=Kribbella sp. NPDC000426 TaxID=3154255 RepID=UPI003325C34C